MDIQGLQSKFEQITGIGFFRHCAVRIVRRYWYLVLISPFSITPVSAGNSINAFGREHSKEHSQAKAPRTE
jgi:hypothetical protein